MNHAAAARLAAALNTGLEATAIYVELGGLSRPIFDALREGAPEHPYHPPRGDGDTVQTKWHALIDYGDGVSLSLWTDEAAKPSPRRLVGAATRRTPEEEYERRFDQDMAAREGELRDLAAEREEEGEDGA